MSDPNINVPVSTPNNNQPTIVQSNVQTAANIASNIQTAANIQSTNVSIETPTNTNQNSQPNTPNNKQKLFKIKEGQILRYKKRLFNNNWKPAKLTLYNNGTFMISSIHPSRRLVSPALIKCNKNSTIIIFGSQIEFILKRPMPPNGYKNEHMLAIGLISHAFSNQGKLKGTQIIFYWFSLASQDELISWVTAFQNSIHSTENTKSNSDIQTMTNNIELNNTANLNDQPYSKSSNFNDDLSLSVMMANTTAFNTNGIGTAGLAAVGAGTAGLTGGLVALNTQYQALFDDRNIRYLGDDATAHMIDPNAFINWSSDSNAYNYYYRNGNNDAVPLAEITTILSAADFLDCGGTADCGMANCSVDTGGGDCSFDGGAADFAFAFL